MYLVRARNRMLQENAGVAIENQTTHMGTQTSPSPSQSSTNLTWASDSCSSPYLTSPSDPDCLDEDSSSSVDGAHSSLTRRHIWCQKPELSTKSSSAPVLKKVPAKVSSATHAYSALNIITLSTWVAMHKWFRDSRWTNKPARSRIDTCLVSTCTMSIRVREYKFFRSLSVKVNDNWPVRKAEQLWRQMRAHKIAGWWLLCLSACSRPSCNLSFSRAYIRWPFLQKLWAEISEAYRILKPVKNQSPETYFCLY